MDHSDKLYTQLSPHYRSYSQKRSAYINAINQIIIKECSYLVLNKKNLIDFGSGDGIRSSELHKKLKTKNLILIDSNKDMIQKCLKIKNAKTKKIDISKNEISFNNKSDIALCLWNVLGHIETPNKRYVALKNIAKIMNENSYLFLDINNRNNISSYGLKAIRNILIDKFSNKKSFENIDFYIHVNNNYKLKAKVHLFKYNEIDDYINKLNMKIVRKYYIDYKTGAIKKFFFQGQILYVIKKLS